MWIQECPGLYKEFVERASGKPTEPDRLEQALSGAKAKRQVGSEELRIIEESPDWPYPHWWPRLSTEFGEPVRLPRDKETAVRSLQGRIKYIEVVSIALRFIFPEEFGVISPPVIGLLNLGPGKDHEEQYLRYISVLEDIRQHYEGLEDIADVDMALWVAAHLDWTEYPAILEEMHQDRALQEIRLRNMLDGLGRYWKRSERARLTLAEVLLKHDHVLAALIAARCFESKVIEMAAQWKITADMRHFGEKELHALVRKLEMQRDAVPADISLDTLRKYRNVAVHNFKPPITKDDARNLVLGVRQLWHT